MKKTLIAVAALATLGTAGAVGTHKASASASTTTSETPVYRLYNKATGEHFYTTSNFEANQDVKTGWLAEGVAWFAPKTGTAVYRVYNPNAKNGDHYYTKSKFEAESLVKQGWKWDNGGKPVFYSGGKTSVYVAYNPNAQSGAHNFTTGAAEQKNLLANGWKYGSTTFEAVNVGISAPDSAQIGQNYTNSIESFTVVGKKTGSSNIKVTLKVKGIHIDASYNDYTNRGISGYGSYYDIQYIGVDSAGKPAEIDENYVIGGFGGAGAAGERVDANIPQAEYQYYLASWGY